MPPNDPGIAQIIKRIKQEIDALAEQQSQAVKWAIYTGMSSETAQEYDQRQKRIQELSRELQALDGMDPSRQNS